MIIYLFLINAVGFVFMLMDKFYAVKNKWRIPENTLMAVALLGGSVGCIAGMQIFRHKTRKPKFSIGLPAILALQIVALIIFFA